jgi:cytochrome P450 family 142 subfamily A polypeptide 1
MSAPAQNPEIRLLDGAFYLGRPLEHYAWLRRHAPVYWDESAGLWGVADHADVMAVSRDPELFCSKLGSRPDSPPIPSMINLDDPQHRRRRNLVNRGFTPRRVEDHERKIRVLCRELIERALAKGQCEFVSEVAAPLPMAVIGDLLGVAVEDRDMLLRWSDDLIAGTDAAAPPAVQLAMMKAATEYIQYAQRVLADRRAKPPADDLMSVLVHAEIDGERLSDDELVQESLLILVGGDETTRHVISGGALALIQRPDALRALQADPSLVPSAVEEMLRFVTPIKNMNRTATRDTELHGRKIRAGDKLLLLYESANRDERVFDAPDVFDPARAPNDHVAFGGYGAHFCLGASLARLELRVMFEELAANVGSLELAAGAAPRLRPSNFIVGLAELPVRLTRRSH